MSKPNRRRGSRRADAPGTGPAEADGPEPNLPDGTLPDKNHETGTTKPRIRVQKPKDHDQLTDRDRWILEERPPHW